MECILPNECELSKNHALVYPGSACVAWPAGSSITVASTQPCNVYYSNGVEIRTHVTGICLLRREFSFRPIAVNNCRTVAPLEPHQHWHRNAKWTPCCLGCINIVRSIFVLTLIGAVAPFPTVCTTQHAHIKAAMGGHAGHKVYTVLRTKTKRVNWVVRKIVLIHHRLIRCWLFPKWLLRWNRMD